MTKDLSETIVSIKFLTKVESYPIRSGLRYIKKSFICLWKKDLTKALKT